MTTAFDQLPKCNFEGIEFPYEDIEIVGGLRDHVHEYAKVDGGDPEIQGRKLYVFRIKANFQRTFRGYSNLYPEGLNKLVALIEAKKIGRLVIPTMGIVEKAYAFGWNRKINVKIRSGEKVDLEFREESIRSGLPFDIAQRAAHISDVPLIEAAAKKPDLLQAIGNAIQNVQNAINSVTAYADQAEMYGNLVEAKVAQLQVALGEFERLEELQEPENYPVVNAVRDLQASTIALARDLFGQGEEVQVYITESEMTIQQVSVVLFGDTTHSMDLLNLNPIELSTKIPAGTAIRYYQPN